MTEPVMRGVLLVLGAYHVVLGGLAMLDPGTFFDEVGRYGVENGHYVGDNGSFTLALGVVLAVAALRPAWRVPVLATTALWYALHALNHAFDVGEARSDARGLFDTIALAAGAAFTVWLSWLAARLQRPPDGSTPSRGGQGSDLG
jgi:hypothetical protein